MKIFTILISLFIACEAFSQSLYFPPLQGDEWETVAPESLNWNLAEIDSLYSFLEVNKTKGFILLKDGRIVLEKYFDNFGQNTSWYWASAGKTLTAALVGIAQHEGLLSLNDVSSKYLGKGWTSLDADKEDLITIWHQLTMTSGLDDTVDDLMCTEPECLKYMVDPGTRWSYHNAPYTLLDKVLEKASGKTYNNYFSEKLRNKIGMTGLWIKSGFNNVYFSNLRSMARFGILIQNNGNWDGEAVIADKQYLQAMVNTSQQHNKSYGYLWWLNGKESFMMPELRHVFKGKLFPNAPNDAIAALGKNGQVLNISQSTGIIFARMGESPNELTPMIPLLSNDIWKYLNNIMQGPNSVTHHNSTDKLVIFPNPATDYIYINFADLEVNHYPSYKSGLGAVKIYNTLGQCVSHLTPTLSEGEGTRIDVSQLPPGVYFVRVGNRVEKFVKC